MPMLTITIQAFVALGFLARASTKFLGLDAVVAQFHALPRHRLIRWSAGCLELFGALGTLISISQPFLAFFVAAFLVALSILTLSIRALRNAAGGSGLAALALAGSVAVGLLQPFGLRVLMLPKASDLPMERVSSARVVKTFGEGMWLESVGVGPDGTIYVTSNRGENYATGDKSRVHAQVIAVSPDGTDQVFFELPPGATAGVIAFGQDGQMYMTGQGTARGIWLLSGAGQGRLLATLPEGSWPNGMTVGPDGALYIADSQLGAIWRVDPQQGEIRKAVESPLLRRRALIALAPGANGIHFHGRDMFVTVSDRGTVLKATLQDDGHFTPFGVFASGIPGDDFAIDEQGTLYITTHPFNTVVRVTPDGTRTLVADAKNFIVGATDAAFGQRPTDRDILYVATDGGAFSGDAKARGTLVAIRIDRK